MTADQIYDALAVASRRLAQTVPAEASLHEGRRLAFYTAGAQARADAGAFFTVALPLLYAADLAGAAALLNSVAVALELEGELTVPE